MQNEDQARALRRAAEIESTRERLRQWKRWAEQLPGVAPEIWSGHRCQSVESRYVRRRPAARVIIRVPDPEGVEIERIVRELPERHRLAIKLTYIKNYLRRDKKLALLGVSKRGYYKLVTDGELMVRNKLRGTPAFEAMVREVLLEAQREAEREALERALLQAPAVLDQKII